MANIKSAKKRAKQTVVRNERNVAQRSMLRTAVKKVIKALDANDAEAATAAFVTAQPLLEAEDVDSRRLLPEGPLGVHHARPRCWERYAFNQAGCIAFDVAEARRLAR